MPAMRAHLRVLAVVSMAIALVSTSAAAIGPDRRGIDGTGSLAVTASGARLGAALGTVDLPRRAALLLDLLDGQASYLIVLDRQADLRGASRYADKAAKAQFVLDALRAAASETQPDLIALLEARGATVRPFVIVNALAVRGDLGSLLAAADFPHTAAIVPDSPAPSALPKPDGAARAARPAAPEWGVDAVRASAVWSLGYTGAGIVVGGQDTGVRWDHDALRSHYRGWDGSIADHDFNWHDAIHGPVPGSPPGNACGFDAPAPCDDYGHGTHTVGTAVGDDGAGNQIGVAPGAQWIACRNMDDGWGAPSTYLECFEWFLAPYPIGGTIADGDVSRAPHILNNSWSCPDYEGCLTGQEIISGVLAMRAAGILTVVSATNYGSSCSTIAQPPAIYAESFTVGAHDASGNPASFSSRGPVTVDGSNRLKPDLAAPGVGVRSALNGSTAAYGSLSGTSMAAPHVAGVAALLWDAAPYLIGDVDLTEWVLRLNAAPTYGIRNGNACRPPGRQRRRKHGCRKTQAGSQHE